MPPDPVHGPAQPRQGVVPGGDRGVAAGTAGHKAKIGRSLFSDAHHGAGHRGAGEKAVHNVAALVQNKGGGDVPCHKYVPNGRGSGAHDLLLSGQRQVDVAGRDEAGGDQVVHGLQHAAELIFHIQCTPAPKNAVLQHAVKGGGVPALGVSGNHVIVGEKHGGLLRAAALPSEEQAGGVDPFHGAVGEHMGIAFRQQSPKFYEFGLLSELRRGDGAAADHTLEVFHGGRGVNGNVLRDNRGRHRRTEPPGPEKQGSQENRQQPEENPKYQHRIPQISKNTYIYSTSF